MTETGNPGTSEHSYTYRNLILWQRAQDFAQAIAELVNELPAGRSTDSIVRQIVRSATSIGANIAEGHGRFSVAAYRNHLSIAKGSACETDSWLDLLRRVGLLAPEQEAELHKKCSGLIAALTRRIRDLERMQNKRAREEPALYDIANGKADSNGLRGPQVRRSQGPPS